MRIARERDRGRGLKGRRSPARGESPGRTRTTDRFPSSGGLKGRRSPGERCRRATWRPYRPAGDRWRRSDSRGFSPGWAPPALQAERGSQRPSEVCAIQSLGAQQSRPGQPLVDGLRHHGRDRHMLLARSASILAADELADEKRGRNTVQLLTDFIIEVVRSPPQPGQARSCSESSMVTGTRGKCSGSIWRPRRFRVPFGFSEISVATSGSGADGRDSFSSSVKSRSWLGRGVRCEDRISDAAVRPSRVRAARCAAGPCRVLPEQQLDAITATIPKNEEMTRQRVLLENALHEMRETVKSLMHIRRFSCE